MNLKYLLCPAISLIAIGMAGLNLFMLQDIKSRNTNTIVMTDVDVVSIVDARLRVLETRKIADRLSMLEGSYSLASKETENKKMLYGNASAVFTLQEYSDTECPYCRKMHAGIKQVIDHSQGYINWEFKHFPLQIHNPAAANQSLLVWCVADSYDNKKAWVVLEELMAQTQGGGSGIASGYDEFVRGIGLNGQIINNCMKSDDAKIKINSDYQDGLSLNIRTAPVIRLINNQTKREYMIKGYKTPEQLLEAVKSVMD
jgi:protein-disulfide isomerase